MQINMNSTDEKAWWFEYEEDPNLEVLIAPLTPPIDDDCTEGATLQPAQVNGRFRRQAQLPKFRAGLYMRLVFRRCVRGWRSKDPLKDALVDELGQPIEYSEETKTAISNSHSGLVSFGFDIAKALGEISAEQVREERARFRGVVEVPHRPLERELPDV